MAKKKTPPTITPNPYALLTDDGLAKEARDTVKKLADLCNAGEERGIIISFNVTRGVGNGKYMPNITIQKEL